MGDVTTYLANTRTGYGEAPLPVPYQELQPVIFPFSTEAGKPFQLAKLERQLPPNVYEFVCSAVKSSALRCSESKLLRDLYENDERVVTYPPYFPEINAPSPLKEKLHRFICPQNVTALCVDTFTQATLGGVTTTDVKKGAAFAKEVADYAASPACEEVDWAHFHNGYLYGFSVLVWHRNRFGEIDAWIPDAAQTYIACSPTDKTDITAVYAFSECGRSFRFATKYAAGVITRGEDPVIGRDVIVYKKPLPFLPVEIYRPLQSKGSSNPYGYSPVRSTIRYGYMLTAIKFAEAQLINWQTQSLMAIYAAEPNGEANFNPRLEDMGFAMSLIFSKDSKVEFISPEPHLEAISKEADKFFEALSNEQALPKTLFAQPDQPTATSSLITHSPLIMKSQALAKGFAKSRANALLMLAAFLHFEKGERPTLPELREQYSISVSIKTFMDVQQAANPANVQNDLLLLAAGARRPVDMATDYNPGASPAVITKITKAIEGELDRKAEAAKVIPAPTPPEEAPEPKPVPEEIQEGDPAPKAEAA